MGVATCLRYQGTATDLNRKICNTMVYSSYNNIGKLGTSINALDKNQNQMHAIFITEYIIDLVGSHTNYQTYFPNP
jgi:hypothetical protein